MTLEQAIQTFGLRPEGHALPSIRRILTEETVRESDSQGAGSTEVMKFCCFLLFSAGVLEDVLLIWRAKAASMDAAASIDVQFLCGAGLNETKAYLEESVAAEAKKALSRIVDGELAGEFDHFSVETIIADYQEYYSEDG